MLDPIISTIDVPCSQEKAFRVFAEDMASWWPLDKRSMSLMKTGKPAKTVRVDAKPGGQIVEIWHDDTELLWGTIKEYDPHSWITMDFHMGLPPETSSLVEVKFTALGNELTRVELTHSKWEGFGDMAEMMRDGYSSGWVLIFEEGYKSACGG